MTTTTLLASVDRNTASFVTLVYQFQKRRLEHARLVDRFLTFTFEPNQWPSDFVSTQIPMPLWRFTRTNGVRRMVPLSTIRGGEGSRGLLFLCTPQQLDGVTCLILSGELDLTSAPMFRTHLAAAQDADGLLLDLRDLRYLDSTGINTLLNAHRALAPSGRRIALVGPSPNVRRILSVLHLEDLMPAFSNVDEALAYLRSGGRNSHSQGLNEKAV